MDTNYKILANKYFEGKINPEEEKLLFDYLSQCDANLSAFRKWESEWKSSIHTDIVTENAWRKFKTLVHESESKTNRNSIRRAIAAAAAVVVLMSAALSGMYIMNRQPEEYFTMTVPAGSKTCLSLPDGSLVWLNAGSRLSYSTKFNDRNRLVKLDGQGYFEVAKHDGAEFVVNTRGYDVVVKGTHFDISAYSDDSYVTTSLMQGSVVIEKGNEYLDMKPGDMVSLDMRTGKFTKSRYSSDNHAWVQDMAEYSDISLEDLAKLLSRKYAVNIYIQSTKLKRMRFSISLRNKETIDDVIDALQRITKMHVTRDGKTIVIKD